MQPHTNSVTEMQSEDTAMQDGALTDEGQPRLECSTQLVQMGTEKPAKAGKI